jgi:hypothetical protein
LRQGCTDSDTRAECDTIWFFSEPTRVAVYPHGLTFKKAAANHVEKKFPKNGYQMFDVVYWSVVGTFCGLKLGSPDLRYSKLLELFCLITSLMSAAFS